MKSCGFKGVIDLERVVWISVPGGRGDLKKYQWVERMGSLGHILPRHPGIHISNLFLSMPCCGDLLKPHGGCSKLSFFLLSRRQAALVADLSEETPCMTSSPPPPPQEKRSDSPEPKSQTQMLLAKPNSGVSPHCQLNIPWLWC